MKDWGNGRLGEWKTGEMNEWEDGKTGGMGRMGRMGGWEERVIIAVIEN